MKIIYIAGPIRNDNAEIQKRNIGKGILAAKAIWQAGGAATCPHMLAYFWGDDDALRKLILEGEIELINRCDAPFSRYRDGLQALEHRLRYAMPAARE
jgi:hypothetical protein